MIAFLRYLIASVLSSYVFRVLAVFQLFRSAAERGGSEAGSVKATSPHLPKGAILHCPVHHYTIGNQTLEYVPSFLARPCAT